jgi:hypothetical protein
MTIKNKGSRKAPRPSRKNVVITPHKGGRVARFECRLTPAENEIIMRLVEASGLSKSDWLMAMAKPNNREQRTGDNVAQS